MLKEIWAEIKAYMKRERGEKRGNKERAETDSKKDDTKRKKAQDERLMALRRVWADYTMQNELQDYIYVQGLLRKYKRKPDYIG